MKLGAGLVLLLLAFAFSAQALDCSMTPTSGPTSGGNAVTVICDDLGDWPYGVVFGDTAATSTERVDASTLRAIAPPHLPGTVDIRLFEYDIFRGTDLTYTFEGDAPEELERYLLPVYVPPIPGAYGSEFVTAFRARAEDVLPITFTGIRTRTGGPTVELGHASHTGYGPDQFEYSGTPGRFFFVKDEYIGDFSASLHVYDTSRAGENRGTQIPIVRQTEFDTRLLLLGVPADPLYRSTLRVYGTTPGTVTVKIGDRTPVTLHLQGGSSLFEPAYAQFTDFPIAGAPVDVKIEAAAPVWAFVSVTNNDTQLITTITP